MDFRVFPVMVIEVEKRRSGKNGGKWSKMAGNGRKWQKIDFRVFHVVAIEVEKGGQVKMVENGRKWWKMDFRDYLVGNGFPRILRHSPTTICVWSVLLMVMFMIRIVHPCLMDKR